MRSRHVQSVRLLAVLAAAAVFAACGSSASTSAKSGASQSSAPATTTAVTTNGGTLTVGAEQEPDCFDWLGSCAASSWGSWMAQYQTIPRVFDVDPRSDGSLHNVPSNLVTSAPAFTAKPVETITYHLNPKAVWSDGVAITCADFAYTVDQEQHSTDILDRTGYTDIARVDCSQPLRPVVTYKPGTVLRGVAEPVLGQHRHLPVAPPHGT